MEQEGQEKRIRSISIQEEVELFIVWLYSEDYVIGWAVQYGEIEVTDEEERKQLVETYLRGHEACRGRK